jgi:hypothetical protein
VTTLAPVALIAWLVLLGALVLAGAELMKRYARNALADEGVWTQLAAHSCQSSSGLGPSLAFMDRAGFLFALTGTVMEIRACACLVPSAKDKLPAPHPATGRPVSQPG